MGLPAGIRAILLDVEGTTTAIDFVTATLFPFAARAIAGGFIARAGTDPEVQRAVATLAAEHAREAADPNRSPPAFGDGTDYALALMREDRKSTGLKALQGLIWQEGYAKGELGGEVFPDVPPALAAWHAAGLRLRIFSSGSVLAQQLLFSTTEAGDLSRCFEGHHDTTTGAKNDPASYTTIAAAFDLPAAAILFVSDSLAELRAAAEAGFDVRLSERPGNPPLPEHGFAVIRTFDHLHPEPR